MNRARAIKFRWARYLWAAPTTAVGIVFLLPALLRFGRAEIVDGVIEIHGGLARPFLERCTLLKGGASAMTLGHIIIGRDEITLDLCRTHEHVHVRQVERWGAFFIPAYFAASLIAWMRGKQPYRDNAFEVEAYGQKDEG